MGPNIIVVDAVDIEVPIEERFVMETLPIFMMIFYGKSIGYMESWIHKRLKAMTELDLAKFKAEMKRGQAKIAKL